MGKVIERIAFVLLAVASTWHFTRVSWSRLRSMRYAKGTLPTDHIGERLWRVFKKVALQEEVIRGRPLTGILHALVMWGFFAFAWASAGHISLGLRGLDAAKENSGWYGSFIAVWACAVLLGILGLTYRRFVIRPKALGPLSLTSGIVAFLIAALMVTYLLGWRALEVGTAAWRVNWWLHTIAFFALLCVIPKSKHFHLVLAPFAIFFGSDRTSAMRMLNIENGDFGLVRISDVSKRGVLDAAACVECGRCTERCPANIVGRTLDPKQIILRMRQGLAFGKEKFAAGSGAEVAQGNAWINEQDLCQCLSCGACEAACPVGIEHVGDKILDMRRGLVSEGRTNNGKLNSLFFALERTGNPWGVPSDGRRKFVEAEEFPPFNGSRE